MTKSKVNGKINGFSKIANLLGVVAIILAVFLATVTPVSALNHTLDGYSGTASAQSANVNPFSGTLSAQSGTLSAQSGTLTSESGTASAQSGSAAQESGTLSAQSGTASAQSGTLSAQSGTLSVQSGTLSAQSGTLSIQSGTLSAQSGTLSMQSGTISMQSGTLNVQSGVISGFSGTLSIQSGTLSTQSGQGVDVSGTLSVQSGTLSMQSYTTNAESGTLSIQSGTMFIYSGTLSTQSGTYTVLSGTLNLESGTLSVQSGTLSCQSGTLSAQSGTLSCQSGTLSMQSGTLSVQSGTLNAQSGMITGFSGTLSMQSGTLSTQSGDIISLAGASLVVHSGTLSAQSGTLSAQSGTLSMQSGDSLYIYSGTLSTQSSQIFEVSGAINDLSGTLSTQSSLIVPTAGTLSAQSGTLSAQSGTLSVQSGTLSCQSGTLSTQSGTLSVQSGTLSAQSGTLSTQSGTASAQSGVVTDFSGTVSNLQGTLSAQSGTYQLMPGDTISVYSGTLSVQSGTLSAQSGTLSAQSGTLFIFSGTLSTQSGDKIAIDSGTLSVQSQVPNTPAGTLSVQSAAILVQCGTLSAQSGTTGVPTGTLSMKSSDGVVSALTIYSGTLSVQSGKVDMESGTLSMQSGTLSVQSGYMDGVPFTGVITGVSGTLSMQSGTLSAQSGTLSMQSGTLSCQSGTLSTQSGTLSCQSGTLSCQSGTLSCQSGTLSAQSGFFAADANNLAADAAMGLQGKWFGLAFTDEPVAPTIEGLALVDFTRDPNGYNDQTSLFRALSPSGILRINDQSAPGGYTDIDMTNVQVDYNDAGYYYDFDSIPDMVIKGKFDLAQPLTTSMLNSADWRNQYVGDFSVDHGEFHMILVGSSGYGSQYGNNYTVYGRIYLYGTYNGEDKVLITDFMNQLEFGVPGLGDCCHPAADNKFHVEGDWYSYPGAYLMGWRAPKLWSTGDRTITSSSSSSVKLSYSTDYVYMPWLTQQFKIVGVNGASWTLPAESIKNVVTTKNNYVIADLSALPSGIYTGEIAATTSDGYVGINGYDHFKIVVAPTNVNLQVEMQGMRDVHTAAMHAFFDEQTMPLTCVWDWGDGTQDTIALPAFSSEVDDVHTYEQAGEYPVTATLYSGTTIVATQSYCDYIGPTYYPWLVNQQALYSQYVGVKGLTPITMSQFENYVITRTYFSDNEKPGMYTGKVYWGDGTESDCGMYGINNRLVSRIKDDASTDALSGLVRGGHVYKVPGTYEIRMVVYKDGAEFAVATTNVEVDTIHRWDGNTEYNGQLCNGAISGVYYTIDWGDSKTDGPSPYGGGRLQVAHTYDTGGFFPVNVSFWLGQPSAKKLITSWNYDMLGTVTRGVDISANGADIVRNGIALGSQDTPMSSAYTMSVDIPTTYRNEASAADRQYGEPGVSTPRLSAIFYWGDAVTSADVVPDANGVVHCEDTHVYAEPGKYTPSVELVVDATSVIGAGTSESLDIRYKVGPIDVLETSPAVIVTADLPGGVDGLTAHWKLTAKDDPSILHESAAELSSYDITATGTFTGVSPGQYIVTLDLKDSSGVTIFTEVYYYVFVG
jgi:hypothetical protein